MAKILITPRSLTSAPPPELDALRDAGHHLVFSTPGKTPTETELLAFVPDIDGWLAGVEPVSDAVIAAARRLRVISRNGTGTDSLPLTVLERRGIALERAAGANAIGVAELAIGLALAACRSIPAVSAGVHAGEWPRLKGREVAGETVGIVGLGAIGRKVATVMAALGARVLGFDPFSPDLGPLAGNVELVTLDTLFVQCRIISLHCPPPTDGTPLIDAAALDTMAKGTILINTARAGLVDDKALMAALDDGRLDHYCTDVFRVEPPGDGSLARYPQVIATSHIGGFTTGSVRRATEMAVAGLLRHLPGVTS